MNSISHIVAAVPRLPRMSRTTEQRWYGWLALISIGSLVPPVIWVLTHELHANPTGDAWYFHWQAALIANGSGWFISPASYLLHHAVVQSALHPPLWVLVLSFADTIGLKSYPAQLLAASVIGAGAVFVTGLAAREVAGFRAGLVAALIAALYPNYWINYGQGLSETLVLLEIAAVILVSFKLWRRPSVQLAIALGVLCGLTALTRAEQVLLIPFIIVPLTLLIRGVALRKRLEYGVVGIVAAAVVMAPWLGFNLSRFTDPTYFSNDSGTTLAMSNCIPAYYKYLGSDDFFCLNHIEAVSGDESMQDARDRQVALRYLRANLRRLPVVLAARPAREFGLFAPLSQLRRENNVNQRPLLPAQIGLGTYYVLVVAGVYGAITLRRRRLTLVPFMGIFVELVVTAMATFGQTRYRAPFEVVLVVLAAVAIDTLVARRGGSTALDPLDNEGSGMASTPDLPPITDPAPM
jgi:4-amino-4-deoxy-L-arabinose transferase-like glycosyltransferase